MKLIDTAARKCFVKFNLSNTVEAATEVKSFDDVSRLTDLPEMWCSLDCMATELGLVRVLKLLFHQLENPYNNFFCSSTMEI